MTKKLKKVVSVKETWSLNDAEYSPKTRWIGEFMDKAPITKVQKTFRVANYNKNIFNQILRNLEIEIEWVPSDNDKEFGRKLNHYFK